MIRSLLIGFFLVLLVPLAAAQEAAQDELSNAVPFHLPRTRWSEDWSILNDPGQNYDSFWRPIKFIRLDSEASSFLSIGGEARLTYERYDPADRGLTDIGIEDAPLLRAAVHTDWHLGPHWRLFGQLEIVPGITTSQHQPRNPIRQPAQPLQAEGISDCPFTVPFDTRPGGALSYQSMRTMTRSCLTHCGPTAAPNLQEAG